MTTRRSLLFSAALLLAATPVLAQPSIVNVQLQPGTPRAIEVTPNATVVCRNNPNCPTELNFRWVGSAGQDDSERLSILYRDGLFWDQEGKPAVVAASDCFSFPGDQNPFTLEPGAANGRNVVFKADEAACPDKVAFFFEISCQNDKKDDCGGIKTLDPGTMVDNGRR
jgi:hypothetical protein